MKALSRIGNRSDVAAAQALFLQVALVVFLGAIEGGSGNNFSDDGLPETCLPALPGCARGLLLFRTVKENGRTVLRAGVRPLPVRSGGVVHLPEVIQQFLVGNFGRIEGDL